MIKNSTIAVSAREVNVSVYTNGNNKGRQSKQYFQALNNNDQNIQIIQNKLTSKKLMKWK